jgi:DNA-binding transcriptional LysR family regulator
MCAVTLKDNPLAKESSVSLEHLANEPFIMLSPDIYEPASRHILNLCKIAGFEPNIVAYCNVVPSMLMLVKCGIEIALVASDTQDLAAEDLKFIPISNERSEMNIVLSCKSTNKNPGIPLFFETARMLMEEDLLQ